MDSRSYRFNKVIVIESLEDFEVKTGLENGKILAGELANTNKSTSVNYIACESVSNFKELIEELTKFTSPDNVPLLHVECHGDILEGLEFSNGSVISWEDLSDLLIPLNIASGCNLMLCLSACYAANFLKQMGSFKTACPCRILVAPAAAIDPAECMRGFRVFYGKLFEARRVDSALEAIEDMQSDGAGWLGEYVEKWFYEVASHFLTEQYSKKAIKLKALNMQKRLKEIGIEEKIGVIKYEIQWYMRSKGLRDMYVRFFGIDKYPEVDKYFSYVFEDFCQWVNEMRKAGHLGF